MKGETQGVTEVRFMNTSDLRAKVRVAVNSLLSKKGYVSPVDVLLEMDRLEPKAYENWRFGRVPYLEKVCVGNLSKLTTIMKELKRYAQEQGLRESRTDYRKWGKGKKIQLRFSKSGKQSIEEAYSTHYLKKQ